MNTIEMKQLKVFYVFETCIKQINYTKWRAPDSLKDSNTSPKLKTLKEKRVGARSLARKTLEG
jgi:hypothetical protein